MYLGIIISREHHLSVRYKAQDLSAADEHQMYRHTAAVEVLFVGWTCYFAKALSSLQYRQNKHRFDTSYMISVSVKTQRK